MEKREVYYHIYQITNNVNGKIYIGKHKTKNLNDNYFGSGKLLKRAIEKHGKENFTKEILFTFDSEEELNTKEKELVTEEFCLREDTYNLCVGGQGGFSYVNREGLNQWPNKRGNATAILNGFKSKWDSDESFRSLIRRNALKNLEQNRKNGLNGFRGKKHTEETKQRMSQTKSNQNTGPNNSQYGTCWITNGLVNRKISKCDPIPEGFIRGRTMTFRA